MGKQRSRASRVSNGGRQKANVAHEAKRQARFAKRREAGTAYQWKPNPYKKGTKAWHDEETIRKEKRWSNSRSDIAIFRSIMAKLDNKLAKEQMANKERKAGSPKRPKNED